MVQYLWLCDKCYFEFFRNHNLITKIINPNKLKRECDNCHKEQECQGCKISSPGKENEE